MSRETYCNSPSIFHKRIKRKELHQISVIVSRYLTCSIMQYSKKPFDVICGGFQEIKERVDAGSFQKKKKWAEINLLAVKGTQE